ncbi:MAG: YqgE/AlgH family protein [Candidatus Hydrogenedentota bacterium]|nr:MAG: YqgE/AlgH family protein [Candidatus Hydrogenedentota bacterium]
MEKFLKGYCLVANYALSDPNFAQTVVFIIDHNVGGAFGLVVNRPTKWKLGEMLPDLPDSILEKEVYQGGPVQPETLFILHNDPLVSDPGEEVIPGVFLGARPNLLDELAEAESNFHVYHGYSGWAPKQLESEMAAKAWVPVKATEKIIFHPKPEKVWREALEYRGGLYEYFARNVKDPFMN